VRWVVTETGRAGRWALLVLRTGMTDRALRALMALRPRWSGRARSGIARTGSSTEDRRVIRHCGRLLLLGGRRAFFNPQVLDICATEDDILIELLRGRDKLLRVRFPMLGAKRPHILKGYGRVIRVDAVEGARIANVAPGDEGDSSSDKFGHLDVRERP